MTNEQKSAISKAQMETIQSRVEAWIKEQRAKLLKVSWGPLQWRMKWPWVGGDGYREHRRRIHQEYERRRKQLHDLCGAVKADSVSDLQDILCCMVLSECVYKRPASDLVRAVNKFKADFGGQIVSLERVQPSSDHVPHSYLLAEAGDTLFASFIGTKQYKDVMTDANIFQGAIFHEDAVEVTNGTENNKSNRPQNGNGNVENLWNPLESKSKQVNDKAKPAAHRGFLARAKGIPALELYRLAQKKKRNLVLCGHSLGGALYLLENSSVKSLSDAEYSKLTSVGSVIAELRERFRSHSMKSYRFRFQRIYDLCMRDDTSPFSGIEQLQQFPHLQQWLGLAVAGTVELGHIVESPVIRTATSVAPLGWNGIPGEKNGDPLKVDITGFGLHLCTLVHAQVNGNWCSTAVESFPATPTYSSNYGEKVDLQKMRVLVGAPLKQPPKQQMVADSFMHVFPIDSNTANLNREHTSGPSPEEKSIRPEGLSEFFIFCTSDFTTVSKEVHVRTRRVRLLGLEGAGKTSLFKAILSQGRITNISNIENLLPETDVQEGISRGLCFCDSAGVNLQELNMEATRFRDELWAGIRDLNRKTDLIVLVHNLSHRIPRSNNSNGSPPKPALSLLLDEAKSLGIPWVLAVTNKFSVSAHQQKEAIGAVIQSYQASPRTTCVINSCPYVMPSAGARTGDADERMSAQKLIYAPINLVRRPFQKKEIILPVEGVNSLRQVVHHALQTHEEAAFQELARDRLLVEMAREHAMAMDASRDSQAKANSLTSAAVGASLGAGLGLVLAVVMGAASALRKP
ncbi:hypothetical protein PRUPE_8G192400 [Prunus persica]|uniref:Fungal lipase-like domain-containing protein n=1 Tax=Prunus persica TaxID=3760 RepID=A0A251N056_PRUPE|nr:hypothetical protein PRUPE_8G192400 [Prunus persica]